MRWIRRLAHVVWVQFQESGAIMAGQRIKLDARYTGDRFAPSPAVEETITIDETITETREVHESRRA
jgi:hypothetical protein